MGFDPAGRRRVRRAGARARPLLLPVAVLLSSLVLASSRSPDVPTVVAPAAPVVPDGMVLVAVQPADPAVLPLAVPGSRLDVYAAAGSAVLDPLGEGGPARADLVVRRALVVGPPEAPGSPPLAGAVDPGGGLGLAGAGGGAGPPTAVTLLVTDAEAEALAARPGGALLLAVRGPDPTGVG